MFPALVLPHFYVVAAVVIASIFPFSYSFWHKETHDLMQKLSDEGHEAPRDEDDNCTTLAALKQRIDQLPTVVKQWLESALSLLDKPDETIIPFARSLRIEQEGTFLLDKKWIPFKATQEFSARQTHPGFVWDAEMLNPWFPGSCNLSVPILVRDAYISGIGGIMKAQLPLGIPVVNQKDSDDLNLGEIMRWLAEATLFPMALIPQEHDKNDDTQLKWSPGVDPDSAILEFTHKGQTAKINFYFDNETHMVKTIQAKRPRIIEGETKLTDWEGHLSDYELHGGFLVPTKMEVGWKLSKESPLELYFRGKNVKFIYLMNSHSRHGHANHETHPHSD